MLFKMEEWEDGCGNWHCNCVSNLAQNSGAWYHPARILNMSVDDYLSFVIKTYEPKVNHNEDCSLVYFTWKSQVKMRKFKNYINAAARKVNYQI